MSAPTDRAQPLERALRTAHRAAGADPSVQLRHARQLGPYMPFPGTGRTRELWADLADLGAADLQLARVVEPHLDALAILDEARRCGHPVPQPGSATWGVFAAEGGPAPLQARRDSGSWHLSGVKPWCSLAGNVTHALVTAWVGDSRRGLFAVAMDDPRISTGAAGRWVARGLRDVVSLPVEMADTPATPVGPADWYLERDGFAWGGMGVAAIWWGGAVGLARRLTRPGSRSLDQVGELHVGRVDQQLFAAGALLTAAADAVDTGEATGAEGGRWALRARGVVAEAVENVLTEVEHALGPGPSVLEQDHAARLADLRVYLRQHHGERDVAALGRAAVELGPWW